MKPVICCTAPTTAGTAATSSPDTPSRPIRAALLLCAATIASPGHAIIGDPLAQPRYVVVPVCYFGPPVPWPTEPRCYEGPTSVIVGPGPQPPSHMGSVNFERAQVRSSFRVTETTGQPPRTGSDTATLGAGLGIYRAETGYRGPTANSIWGQYDVQAVSEMRREGWLRTRLSLSDGNTTIGSSEASTHFSARYSLANIGAQPIPGDFSANIEPSQIVLGGRGIYNWSAGAVAASFDYRVQVQDTNAQGATQTVADWWWQASVQSRDNLSVGFDPLTGRWRGNMVQLPWRGQPTLMPDWIDASFQLLADTTGAGAPTVTAWASDDSGTPFAIRHFDVQPFGLTLQLPTLAPGDTRSFMLDLESQVFGNARSYGVEAIFIDPAQMGRAVENFGLNGLAMGAFAQPVPEPATAVLFMMGGALLLVARRRPSARAWALPVMLASWMGGATAAPGATAPADVVVNGRTLDAAARQAIEVRTGVPLKPGRWWYDARSGLWGIEGQGPAGFAPAGMDVGAPLPAQVSGGRAGVFFNGRNLADAEIAWLRTLGPVWPGRYWLDDRGNVGFEGQALPFANLIQLAQARSPNKGGGRTPGGTVVASDGRCVYVSGRSSSGIGSFGASNC